MSETQRDIERASNTPPAIEPYLRFVADRLYRPRFTRERSRSLQRDFETGFSGLSFLRQQTMRDTLAGISGRIEDLPNLNQALEFVNALEIRSDILDTLGETGMIGSIRDDGLDRVREDAARMAPGILAELDFWAEDIPQTAREFKRRKRFQETADGLLSIRREILSELIRLQLADPEVVSKRYLFRLYEHSYLPQLSDSLKSGIRVFGLVGFSRVPKLIDGFYDFMKYSAIADGWIR